MTHPETRRETADTKPGRVYLHPVPVRIWHWVNALGFVLLILTGIQIRYADLFNVLSFELATELHNWIGFLVTANWFLWFFYYIASDKITNYHPDLDAYSLLDACFCS